MSARHYSLGITSQNYEETYDILTEMMEIMRKAKFGHEGRWKPFQRGFIISTTSILEISEYLLKEKQFSYVLPGRVEQDCLENLFSTIRSGNPKRNALQIRDSIKQITVSEYLSPPLRHSAYQWDDSEFVNNFLKIVRSVKAENEKQNLAVQEIDKENLDCELDLDLSMVVINRRERNVLYKIACYILYKITISKVKVHCDHCLSSCRLPHSAEHGWYSKLTRQPNFQYKSNKNVVHINEELYLYFLQMEKFFRLAHPILSKKNKYNLGKLMTNKILDLGLKLNIPTCHSLMKTITSRFIIFRLKNAGCPKKKKKQVDLSSRTMN